MQQQCLSIIIVQDTLWAMNSKGKKKQFWGKLSNISYYKSKIYNRLHIAKNACYAAAMWRDLTQKMEIGTTKPNTDILDITS